MPQRVAEWRKVRLVSPLSFSSPFPSLPSLLSFPLLSSIITSTPSSPFSTPLSLRPPFVLLPASFASLPLCRSLTDPSSSSSRYSFYRRRGPRSSRICLHCRSRSTLWQAAEGEGVEGRRCLCCFSSSFFFVGLGKEERERRRREESRFDHRASSLASSRRDGCFRKAR